MKPKSQSKSNDFLKRKKVSVESENPFILRCDQCKGGWSPNLQRGGKLARGYWKCPCHGCNVSKPNTI